MKIKGKNVIITGAASGVGKELTKQMLKIGYKKEESNFKMLKPSVAAAQIIEVIEKN